MKKKNLICLLVLVGCMALPFFALAQDPPPVEDTPIDGGLGLLLAAGVGYGVKKYRDSRKKRSEDGVISK